MFTRNQIQLTGNIAKPAETRSVGESSVTRTRLMHNDTFRKSNGETVERLVAIDLEIWDKRGKAFEEYVTTKTPVYVEGKIVLDQWKAEDGTPRSKLFVKVDGWQFLSAPSQEGQSEGGRQDSGSDRGHSRANSGRERESQWNDRSSRRRSGAA